MNLILSMELNHGSERSAGYHTTGTVPKLSGIWHCISYHKNDWRSYTLLLPVFFMRLSLACSRLINNHTCCSTLIHEFSFSVSPFTGALPLAPRQMRHGEVMALFHKLNRRHTPPFIIFYYMRGFGLSFLYIKYVHFIALILMCPVSWYIRLPMANGE
ncbi:hypothetical protein SAMN05216168_4497 [Kosakonia radicincitans]|nr:hypothetical protein SAMN05216168_4497 [Kosakonia radicincitans]